MLLINPIINDFAYHFAEHQNHFVMVQVVSESASINCIFLNVSKGTPTSCNATIIYGQTCQEQILLHGIKDDSNDHLVVISLRNFLQETQSFKHCSFVVHATVSTMIITVEGDLLGKSIILLMYSYWYYTINMLTNAAISINNPSSTNTIIAAAVVLIVILIVIIVATILAFSLYIGFYVKVSLFDLMYYTSMQ